MAAVVSAFVSSQETSSEFEVNMNEGARFLRIGKACVYDHRKVTKADAVKVTYFSLIDSLYLITILKDTIQELAIYPDSHLQYIWYPLVRSFNSLCVDWF